ncbi:hypothetical protein [Rhodococcus phenolicus]|uniref:hypothetical protein n=1 Tax=Rhodococcus phenolicus TaxID=263849 RepID=UPI000B0A0BDD|nr:hypothetical protein [Rhodococcus phenolicus]
MDRGVVALVVVNVPADFDLKVVGLGDVLGSLEDDGFLGVVREGIVVRCLGCA